MHYLLLVEIVDHILSFFTALTIFYCTHPTRSGTRHHYSNNNWPNRIFHSPINRPNNQSLSDIIITTRDTDRRFLILAIVDL